MTLFQGHISKVKVTVNVAKISCPDWNFSLAYWIGIIIHTIIVYGPRVCHGTVSISHGQSHGAHISKCCVRDNFSWVSCITQFVFTQRCVVCPSQNFSVHKNKAPRLQKAIYRAPECNVPRFWRIGQDAEILLPVKFRWIPFSGFREVEKVSAKQRPGRPSCFIRSARKTHLGRGRWDLSSCQIPWNSIQRRSRKCFSKSETLGSHLVFPISPKNTTW